jgi:tetratricopeptide (TPR) repeat protein
MTGCVTAPAKQSNSLPLVPQEFSGFSVAQNSDNFKDVSAWIDSVPQIDRIPAISQVLNRTDLSTTEEEILFNRLTKLSTTEHHIIQWAQSRIENADYAGALDLLSQPQFATTQNPQVLYLKGRCFLALKRYDEADKALLRAIHYNRSNTEYYNALAYVSSFRGQDSRAEAALNKSIIIDSNQPYALYNIAVSEYNNEMYKDALEHFTKSALLYKKSKQDFKVTRIIGDINDMEDFVEKKKIKQAINTINNL